MYTIINNTMNKKNTENHQPTLSNARVDVADVLRGLAVMGIIILHSIEHFNFYSFPQEVPYEWMRFTDRAIWDGLFFAFSGKAYAVFALLFGFSFYIQDDNQRRRGNDFRLRFVWRLLLLFIIGQVNAMFFTGEILTMYAMIGIVLPLFCRASNKVVITTAVVLMLQPLDWGKLIYALIDPAYEPATNLAGKYFSEAFAVQSTGNFIETVKMNMCTGQLANLAYALEHGRITQTAGLFLFGMVVGRRGWFLPGKENEQLWLKTLGIALLCFFPLYGLNNMLADFVTNKAVLAPLGVIVVSTRNLAFMAALVAGLLITFYRVKNRRFLMRFAPYGKMSLSNYLGQSVIGSLLFYHWGFEWGRWMGVTYSFIFGIIFVLLQMVFCTLWLSKFKHGPFEGVWKKLTWIKSK